MMSICKKLNIPLIVHFHGYDAYRNDILNSFENRYKELFDKASAVIGVSLDMCLQLMSLGCPQPKLHYLPYGIDTNIFKLDAKNKRSLTFVACGRFVEKKAPHLTIKAFSIVLKEVPEAKMIMIGEGELLNDCKKLSKELNIQNAIRFTGILSQDEIADIYNNSLAFVQHSIKTDQNDSEGTPLVILESGAAGLPVVSTLHAGIIDVVEEGETGFLVKEKDVEGMANRMLFLAKNRLVAMEMGQKAIQKIRTDYNIEAYTQRLWELMSNNIG
ncbi:MAG: glycosyltransferase family 4 protein [Flavobacteriales bacterium]|nr:glycosyltransferase family 4 protein [Flavobacteriales bacterium]